jgi:hypothetical protein
VITERVQFGRAAEKVRDGCPQLTAGGRGSLGRAAGRPGGRHGRGLLTLHLPEGWHREHAWLNLFEAACGPPAAAA